ncbi:unnamed protein product [Schistosoma turkestanicum]|nr:unnamed protein product [Schistosoma turkestanicum]
MRGMVHESPSYLYCECEFSGKVYDTSLYLENPTQLKLELANRITNEEWHVVEELTRKTGNFKRFDVFCSMLQSALSKRSNFLKLDLLNYEDLNEIRRIKILNDYLPPRCSVTLNGNKRYLILSYTTEFDKIHYPIPLLFVGCPTPDVYRNIIHELRVKLFSFGSTMSFPEHQLDTSETGEAISKISKLQSENMALRRELLYVKESLNNVKSCRQTHLGENPCQFSDKAKHTGLKAFVDNLETELYEEKSKASRQMVKYTREIARLQSDLEVAVINQRGMRRKIDQLSEELYFLKGGSLHRKSGNSRTFTHSTNNKSNQVSRINRSNVFSSQKSREPIFTLLNCKANVAKRRAGSASPTICRTLSHGSSKINNTCPNPLNKPFNPYKQRTNSLDRALSGNRRFDPTAYIQERERKREENALKRLAQQQSLIGALSYQRTRSSSCTDNRYNSNVKNITSQFARTSGTTSPAFSSCESGLDCTTRKPYNRVRHPSCCTHRFNRPNTCSPHPSVLQPSRSPANGYYSSSSPEPVNMKTNQNISSKDLNSPKLPAPLNEICTSRSSRSRSIVKSPSLSERHQVDNEMDSDISICSGRLSRRSQPRNRNVYTKKEKTIHDTDAELDEIDHRLNVLQGFFEKYLTNS